jgi:integrase
MRGATSKLTESKIESRIRQATTAAAAGYGKPILLGDGGGLTLQISKAATASWLYRYMRFRRPVAMGLGRYPAVPLTLARQRAELYRQLLAQGKDPLSEKRAAAAAGLFTFETCARAYIDDHRPEWKNAKHVQQWGNTLQSYAFPKIGARAVGSITTVEVSDLLKPIWAVKNETATRVRARIEAVLDWATARGLRTGDNPARWKGHLEHLLAKSTPRTREQRHHAALHYGEMPAFIKSLAPQQGTARWALEFLILTAARTSEVTGARWCEIVFENRLWTIPAWRMKGAKEHRVPLVEQTLCILEEMRQASTGEYIFCTAKHGQPLSNMAMAMLLRRMGRSDITVHGFRSTFRDYIGAETGHDFLTAEAALAHRLKDRVMAAYARSDLVDKRFRMMRDWAIFCHSCDG